MFLPFNVLSQSDTTFFYDLKLMSDKIQIIEKREGKSDKIKTRKIADSYFFFTDNGIYGADEFGMMIYEFITPVEVIEDYLITKYFIKAKDIDLNKNCSIVIYHYYENNKYKMFVKYKHNQYIFNCETVE